MSFTCLNKSCHISISKTSFAMPMPCPLCKLPLSQFQAYDTIYMDYNYYTKINYGNKQFKTADDYYNEALSFEQEGNYEKSLELFEIALNSALNEEIPPKYFISYIYNKIGISAVKTRDYKKALSAFAKTIEMELIFHNGDESKVYGYFINMALTHKLNFDFLTAIKYYKKCIEIKLKLVEEFHPDLSDLHFIIAECYELANKLYEAYCEFVLSAEIYRSNAFNYTFGLNSEEAISNAKRLAKLMGRENELPVWMKEL